MKKVFTCLSYAVRDIICHFVGHTPEALGVLCRRCNKVVRKATEVTLQPLRQYQQETAHQHLVAGLRLRDDVLKRRGNDTWYRDIYDEYVAILKTIEPGERVPTPPYMHHDSVWREPAERKYRETVLYLEGKHKCAWCKAVCSVEDRLCVDCCERRRKQKELEF